MREVSLEELLEAGCHFGHQVTRQNPKARDYVFEARDNIHIIDLAKTKEGLESAAHFVKELAKKNGSLIVVGTKRQAQGIVREEVTRAHEETGGEDGLYTITNRWIGGILTNLSEVSKNFKKLKDYGNKLQSDEEKSKYTKKEIGQWQKDRVKLEGLYGGVQNMKSVPEALFIIDTHLEDLSVREAARTGIKTVGIVDTNADPNVIDYPIPANDDAVGSIKLIVSYIIDSWIEGRKAAKNEAGKEGTKGTKETKGKEASKNQEEKNDTKEKKSSEKEEKPKAKKTTKRTKKIEGKA